jgi:uncharacterized membrane protein
VGEGDSFCASCGTRQQGTPAAPVAGGISPRTASRLCYIPFLGWIASIFVLATDRFRGQRDVRFHAFQGLYLFVAWLLVDWVIKPYFHFFLPLGKILQLVVFALWIVMMIKASKEERYALPLIGELAERSL